MSGDENQGSTGNSPAAQEQLCHWAFVLSDTVFNEALTLWQMCVLRDGWNILRGLQDSMTFRNPPTWDGPALDSGSRAFTSRRQASAWESPQAPASSSPLPGTAWWPLRPREPSYSSACLEPARTRQALLPLTCSFSLRGAFLSFPTRPSAWREAGGLVLSAPSLAHSAGRPCASRGLKSSARALPHLTRQGQRSARAPGRRTECLAREGGGQGEQIDQVGCRGGRGSKND